MRATGADIRGRGRAPSLRRGRGDAPLPPLSSRASRESGETRDPDIPAVVISHDAGVLGSRVCSAPLAPGLPLRSARVALRCARDDSRGAWEAYGKALPPMERRRASGFACANQAKKSSYFNILRM